MHFLIFSFDYKHRQSYSQEGFGTELNNLSIQYLLYGTHRQVQYNPTHPKTSDITICKNMANSSDNAMFNTYKSFNIGSSHHHPRLKYLAIRISLDNEDNLGMGFAGCIVPCRSTFMISWLIQGLCAGTWRHRWTTA